MKVVYCTWGENSYDDTRVCLNKLVEDLVIVHGKISEYLDGGISGRLILEIPEDADVVFSWDFIPIISEVCRVKKLTYISYVYDWPNLTLFKEQVLYECNRIYLFDRDGVNKIKELGVEKVFHLPLGVLTEKFSDLKKEKNYRNEVSFVGNLYPKLDHILPVEQMPQYAVGYIEGICQVQQRIYGYNMVGKLVDDELAKKAYITYPGFIVPTKDILAENVTRVTTGLERRRLLEAAGKVCDVDLYTYVTDEEIENVRKHPPVSYNVEMPRIFHESKINLNITLRSITSGVSLRVLDILNAGGFCLTNYQPEIAELFEDGKELVMFESEQDMQEKIRYYLEHEDEREEIAENGYKKVQRDFSLLDRLNYILRDSVS